MHDCLQTRDGESSCNTSWINISRTRTSPLTILLLMDPNFLLEFIPVVPRSDFQESKIPINIREGVHDGGSRREINKRKMGRQVLAH